MRLEFVVISKTQSFVDDMTWVLRYLENNNHVNGLNITYHIFVEIEQAINLVNDNEYNNRLFIIDCSDISNVGIIKDIKDEYEKILDHFCVIFLMNPPHRLFENKDVEEYYGEIDKYYLAEYIRDSVLSEYKPQMGGKSSGYFSGSGI